MPQSLAPAPKTPSYRKHKASGQAIVTLNGRMIYLGPYGSVASKHEYDRVIAEWLSAGRQLPGQATPDLTVSELAARYWEHATTYYGSPSGRGELDSIKLVLGLLRRLYGATTVCTFGPRAFKSVRDQMVVAGWSRPYINAQARRVRRIMKWAVEAELVPAEIWHALQAVEPLRAGKTQAREPAAVQPVSEDRVAAMLSHVSPQVRSMIELQQLTGMRAGELVIMRGCDINRIVDPWEYTPSTHKNQHRGLRRMVPLGPRAQAIIAPYLGPDADAYLFSPAEAEGVRRAKQHEARETPLSCGNRPGTNKVRRGRKRAPRDRYDVASYRRAIAHGCDAAFPPPADLARGRRDRTDGKKGQRRETMAEWKARLGAKWPALLKWRMEHRFFPLSLRHSAGTRLREQFGIEGAQGVLGHQRLNTTEIYAQKNIREARRIMREVG